MKIAQTIRNKLILTSRNTKIFLTILSDLFCLNLNFFLCYFLLYFIYIENFNDFANDFPLLSIFYYFGLLEVILLSSISIFIVFSLNGYKSFFRSSNAIDLIGSIRILSILAYNLLLFSILKSKNITNLEIPFSLYSFINTFFYYFVFRLSIFKFISFRSISNTIPIIIYGAGQAGKETVAYLSQSEKYKIIGFLDDAKSLKNYSILGYKVFGGVHALAKLKKDYPDLLIIMAMVNLKNSERRKLISRIENYEIKVKTIPANYGSLQTRLSIENVKASDLIDRKVIEPVQSLLTKNIERKVVLITGAGGSIGSEISNQVANLNPKKIILIDFSEFNLFKLKEKFQSFKNFQDMKFILEDIKNIDRINSIIINEKVETIYHAAAYKHVPLLEEQENFEVALRNNFFSTFDLCRVSARNLISTFILISSDKAVNPPNLMGATKRLAELALQAFQDKEDNSTNFSVVRFGNVLNSSGSVVPMFWEQIYSGGPVTVTHEDVNRYFMTIEEAASLVIQAGALSEGGEVYLLDMGDPIKIKKLAERMIRLSGSAVANINQPEGIEIIFSGLRPGEKIYEELLISNNFLETIHKSIKKGIESKYPYNEINNLKINLEELVNSKSNEKAINLISRYVEGYPKKKF